MKSLFPPSTALCNAALPILSCKGERLIDIFLDKISIPLDQSGNQLPIERILSLLGSQPEANCRDDADQK